MSWFANLIAGEYLDPTYVPDTQGTFVPDSYAQPTNPYENPTSNHYRDNALSIDLNTPAEYSYEQAGYSGYGYEGEPAGYSGYGYGGEPSGNPSYGYGGDPSGNPSNDYAAEHAGYTSYGYGAEQCGNPNYGYGGQQPGDGHGGNPSFVQTADPIPAHSRSEDRRVDGGKEYFPVVGSFETDHMFTSREEMTEWVKTTGKENGYLIVTKRSKSNKWGVVYKVCFMCTFGGEHKSVAKDRKTGSKKMGCPFDLVGVLVSSSNSWRIIVRDPRHNHTPIQYFEGHAYARRLSSEDKRLVEEMADQDIPNRTILRVLKYSDPEKNVIGKDIHNLVQKINKEKNAGASPMQLLESVLMEQNYTYFTRENPATNAVEDVFFVHRHSFTMWRAFPHVLLIDATYSTNMYKLPFVQVVGMTSTNMSFAIAHALISAEKTENYQWVLDQISNMLTEEGCMKPRVIVTDRELSLIRACEKTFPNARMYLCRVHICMNVSKHTKIRFTDMEWKQFIRTFNHLCDSTSVELYNYTLNYFEANLIESGHGETFEYLKVNWLDPYREKFVAAWTDETLNFHQVTTNRVESMHALLKSDLPTHRTTLDKLVRFIGHMVDKQYTEIRRSFEESIRKVMNHHREEPMFAPLLRKVSIYALELLTFELRRMSEGLEIYGSTCNCSLYKSCGLPCACRLEGIKNKGQKVQLSSIDAHWKKLDFEPATKNVKDLDVDAEWEKIKQQFDFRPVQVKMSMFQKIKAIVTPSTNKKKPPVVKKNTRGRPTLKQQAERREEAERSSSYLATDQSETPYGTSYGPSLDPPRHSSYVASTSSQKQSSGIIPPLQRSKTTVRARTKTPELPLSPHPDFPRMPPTRKSRALIRNLGFLIPDEYRPYITKIKDVKPDGHCGFRATAVGVGQKQDRHKFIRTKLLEQMRRNECMWRQLFDHRVVGGGVYDKLYTRINWQGRVAHAEPQNYMEMPNCGYLIAQEWGVIVTCIIGHTKLTIFPMDGGPEHAGFPHTVVPIQLVRGNHFIYLRFEGDYPMPPVPVDWHTFRRESAAGWYKLYEHRIVNELPDLNQEPQDVG